MNLTIDQGSFHTLIGASGSGKTTTLKLIASLLKINSGSIQNLPAKITYAFQTSPLIPWLTVKENLKLCSSESEETDHFLKSFSLADLSHKFPDQLSGGMIQKINILRSFLGNPDLILMDEPFVHIDVIQKEELHHFLLELWKNKKPTIIFVTHDINEALYLSEKISLYNLHDKKVQQTLDVSALTADSYLNLPSSQNYQNYFNTIYSHLKTEQMK